MQDELRQKKLLYFSVGYMTNINYFIMILVLVFNLEFDRDPYMALIILGIPAAITIIASTIIIRNNLLKEEPRTKGLVKLGIAHSFTLVGLIGALIYLFV